MNFDLLLENITNPALLFFYYHRCSSKSDLEIPENSLNSSLYLLFSIGFKGGQELSLDIIWSCRGVLIAIIIPFYSFLFLKTF
jgi:hypothetical protein